MTASRDPNRLIRAFLAEGLDELPDPVYDAVRDRIEQTNQRVVIGPWRTPFMNKFVAIGLAAAAVVVVAFIGYQLFAGPNVGGPGTVVTPTAVPTATAAPSEEPDVGFPPAGALAIGRHTMTLSGIPLSFEIATDGWVSNGEFGIDKGHQDTSDSAGFIFWRESAPNGVYADPCAGVGRLWTGGPAELAAAVSTAPGLELISGPSDVTVGGRPAKHVVVTVPDDIGCSPNDFYLWEADGLGRYATELNSTIYVWIIDVDGTLVWIDGETYVESGPEAEQEIRQIVDSIQFL